MRSMKTMRNQSGFSLVELMVVVAIIGILATMSVGAIQKQIAKARQSEAKQQLSSLYTSEKAFFAEYNTYSGGLNVIAYSPEGNLRYNIGFSANTPAIAALQTFGYNGPAPGNANSLAECPAAGNTRCRSLAEATAGGAIAGATATATTFVGQARSQLRPGTATTTDVWTINQAKVLNNNPNGVDGI